LEKKSVKPAPKAKEKEQPEKPVEKKTHEHDPLLEITEKNVSKLLNLLGYKAQVSAHYDDDDSDDRHSIHVDVRGDDLSALIGRHAETLNAFQYVASLIVGKEAQQWVQLVVDVEGYRSRREKQIRQLARRMADQVTKTGRRASLEPMTSSERRVVHIELRDDPAVITESTGEDPYRKVVIVPKDS
jgi:spoIIIJ-associated protein